MQKLHDAQTIKISNKDKFSRTEFSFRLRLKYDSAEPYVLAPYCLLCATTSHCFPFIVLFNPHNNLDH